METLRVRGMNLEKEKRDICLVDACIEGNILYAAGFEKNILLKYDVENQETKLMGVFKGFKFSESYHNNAIFKYEESLFCFSKNSYEVAEFNLEEKRFKYYYPTNNIQERDLVRSIIRIEDNIWMMRTIDNPLIMVFSMRKKRYIEHEIDMKISIENYIPLGFEKCVCIGREIWRCIPGRQELFILDTKNLKTRVFETGLSSPLLTIYTEENVIYILSASGQELISIDADTYGVSVYKTGYEGIVDWPFVGIVKVKNLFIFLPCFEQKILCYELKNDKLYMIKEIELPVNFKRVQGTEKSTLFLDWKKVHNTLYLLPFSGNSMVRLDLDTFAIALCPVNITRQDYLIWSLWIMPVQSEKEISLKEYLNTLTGEKVIAIKNTKEIKRLENFIWKFIKGGSGGAY